MSLRTIKRRRREQKTNYQKRLGMLKSSLDRIVIRKTNRYVIIQIVGSQEAQDKVKVGITSKDLLEHGWDSKLAGSLKSIPACYLAGYLMAKKVKSGEYILDVGMTTHKMGGRTYAVAAGLIDGGLKIRVGKEVLPSKERIEGEHLEENVQKILKKVKESIK
jgi:large subunit ribosomal protein L18